MTIRTLMWLVTACLFSTSIMAQEMPPQRTPDAAQQAMKALMPHAKTPEVEKAPQGLPLSSAPLSDRAAMSQPIVPHNSDPKPGAQGTGKPAPLSTDVLSASGPAYDVSPATQGSETVTTVSPEIATVVQMSASDINRVVCHADIRDVVFSAEKGLVVKTSGKNSFVKFKLRRDGGRDEYSKIPSELFIVCGNDVYNIIALPKRIPAQTVVLSTGTKGKMEKNRQLYGTLPHERKVNEILKSLYTDAIAEGLDVRPIRTDIPAFANLRVHHVRDVIIAGEGLRCHEYDVTSLTQDVDIREKDFLTKAMTAGMRGVIAVSLDKLSLAKGETARLYIVEGSVAQ